MKTSDYFVCPMCESVTAVCPECGKTFDHGEASQCDESACKVMNTPLDCICGFVVSSDCKGVLDFENKFIEYLK